jgi:hypothetical protein
MAQRCSYCGKTEKQHRGRPCVDVAGLRKGIIYMSPLEVRGEGNRGI